MSDPEISVQDIANPTILTNIDDVSSFNCGIAEIDEFIQDQALDYQVERLGVTYLFRHKKTNDLLGFVTLSMADLKRKK